MFEDRYFFPLESRELDSQKSGSKTIYNLLTEKYDSVEFSVKTSYKHKLVNDLIEKLSNKQLLDFETNLVQSPTDKSSLSKEKIGAPVLAFRKMEHLFLFNEVLKEGNIKDHLEFVGTAMHLDQQIRLTSAPRTKGGAVWLKKKHNIHGGFVCEFDFVIKAKGGDGFAFVLQNTSETALGKKASEMGYGGLESCLAVEFDTDHNNILMHDPNGNHIRFEPQFNSFFC